MTIALDPTSFDPLTTDPLTTEPRLSRVSSSELKARVERGEPIDAYGPPVVAARLRARITEARS